MYSLRTSQAREFYLTYKTPDFNPKSNTKTFSFSFIMDKLIKKLQNDLKLSGFILRREFCELIVTELKKAKFNLLDPLTYDNNLRIICNNLEKLCSVYSSIERSVVEKVVELCLNHGFESNETVFNVIGAFDFPKLIYNPDLKRYTVTKNKSDILPGASSKATMYQNRYSAVLQRTRRVLKQKESIDDPLSLQTVDYLLTISHKTLDRTLILGSLLKVGPRKYNLEDPTGMIELDLSHANFHVGLYPETCFVLVNGQYEDKVLKVSTICLPPGESYTDSKISFGSLNYFGGDSQTLLRESRRLQAQQLEDENSMILFFSDVWLDRPQVLEMLETCFQGFNESVVPIAFVFLGNFLSNDSFATDRCESLRKLFKQLGETIRKFHMLMNHSTFVFVPGTGDICVTNILPRPPLPSHVTEELTKLVPKAIFTTNPCRIQYCAREISILRADIFVKMMQSTVHKPEKQHAIDSVMRTLVSQGHMTPFTVNTLPVFWEYDYTLYLYPLPNLVVIGDKSEPYSGKYKGCNVINPGAFMDSGYSFKSYIPSSDTIDNCTLGNDDTAAD